MRLLRLPILSLQLSLEIKVKLTLCLDALAFDVVYDALVHSLFSVSLVFPHNFYFPLYL